MLLTKGTQTEKRVFLKKTFTVHHIFSNFDDPDKKNENLHSVNILLVCHNQYIH